MSEWRWKIWRIGWLREKAWTRTFIEMGPSRYVVWWMLGGRLAFRLRTVPHHGRYWEAVMEARRAQR